MVIEAGVVAGYVVAWALRKAQRAGHRLDAEADAVMDASLDRLHEVVESRLGGHPVLVELVEEAEQDAEVADLTRQQVELALTAAALKDEPFGRAVTELVAHLRELERAAGPVAAEPGSTVFSGAPRVDARDGGFAFGQVAGGVYINQKEPDPQEPGRSRH